MSQAQPQVETVLPFRCNQGHFCLQHPVVPFHCRPYRFRICDSRVSVDASAEIIVNYLNLHCLSTNTILYIMYYCIEN